MTLPCSTLLHRLQPLGIVKDELISSQVCLGIVPGELHLQSKRKPKAINFFPMQPVLVDKGDLGPPQLLECSLIFQTQQDQVISQSQ